MAVNSSLAANTTLHPYLHCDDISRNSFLSLAFTLTKILLLSPLTVFTLYPGQQRWRQQRSSTTMSHADFFALQMAAMELISEAGWVLFICGADVDLPLMVIVGFCLVFGIFPGHTSFHILACVERYLAVVHPVTYLGLKQPGRIRIRNVSARCAWLLSFGWKGITALYVPDFPLVPFLSFFGFSLLVVSFCSLSVLRVLIRPGPGEVGGGRERVDQSKQRAFNTIMAIMGVLWLMFLGIFVCVALDASPLTAAW